MYFLTLLKQSTLLLGIISLFMWILLIIPFIRNFICALVSINIVNFHMDYLKDEAVLNNYLKLKDYEEVIIDTQLDIVDVIESIKNNSDVFSDISLSRVNIALISANFINNFDDILNFFKYSTTLSFIIAIVVYIIESIAFI